jgi:hypothetical protein
MTFIEFLILYLSISIAGGYYVGTNDNLAQPYKNSQNTYLKIIIKRNLNNESLESSLGNYLSFPSVYLKPNQTLLVRMETINGDLDTESNGKEWSEIIATPSDLKEIQKCNFVNTQNEN